jgi:glycosyltransferase involved in cell wall biosynthesis
MRSSGSELRVLIALDLPLVEGFGESEYVRGTAETLRTTAGRQRLELAVAAVATPESAQPMPDWPDIEVHDLHLEITPVFGRSATGVSAGVPYTRLQPEEIDAVQRQLHAGLAETVRKFRPHVVHVHHAFLLVPAAAVLGAIWEFPFVVSAHGTDTKAAAADRRYVDIIGPSLRRASGLTAVSGAVRRELGELFGPRVERGVNVVPGGVDTDYFKPQEQEKLDALDREHGLAGEQVVLFVGPLTREKGADLVLEAARMIGDVQFRLVGQVADGSYGSRVEERAGQIANVAILGRLDRAELLAWYSRANVLVMPARDEAFGLVALEAMACGTPVVVARSAAMERIISDGVNGYLVDPGQVYQLARGIRDVLDDESYEAMRIEARATVADRYSWGSVVEHLRPVYRRARGPAQPFASGG